MISSIHTIKVALAGDYNFARVAAVEDDQECVLQPVPVENATSIPNPYTWTDLPDF